MVAAPAGNINVMATQAVEFQSFVFIVGCMIVRLTGMVGAVGYQGSWFGPFVVLTFTRKKVGFSTPRAVSIKNG